MSSFMNVSITAFNDQGKATRVSSRKVQLASINMFDEYNICMRIDELLDEIEEEQFSEMEDAE